MSSTDASSYCYLLFIWQFCLLHNSSFWGIINPYLKDMGIMNVVKAAMNSRDTAKNLTKLYKGRT